jgi:hypothetical protein
MGKRGPPATRDHVKQLRGTDRPDRAHPRMVPALSGEPVMPAWLEGLGEAPDVWRRKVAKYRAPGMSVAGCEDQLAQLCAYEASVIARWRGGEEPSAASMNVLNKYASQFYETPSTQHSQSAAGKQSETENFWDRFKVVDGGKSAS